MSDTKDDTGFINPFFKEEEVTKEEAIEYLKSFRKLDEGLYDASPYKTVSHIVVGRCLKIWDMAIEALEQNERAEEWYKLFVEKLEQEPNRDIKEIAEVLKCDADAETKCKMISNILTAKPHYFEVQQEPCETCGYEEGSPFCLQYCPYDAERKKEQEPTVKDKQAESEKYQKAFDDGYSNGYAQARFDYEQEPCEDAISREAAINIASLHCLTIDETVKALELLPSVTQKPIECDDAISRRAVLDAICDYVALGEYEDKSHTFTIRPLTERIKHLPSVTQKLGHCKECKYFEYDSMAKVDGIPLIVAHEICNKWGDGCKTCEDGYCYLFEPQESEE